MQEFNHPFRECETEIDEWRQHGSLESKERKPKEDAGAVKLTSSLGNST